MIARIGNPYLFVDVERFGGKGKNLLELGEGFPVPNGFVVSSDIYREWVKENRLDEKIRKNIENVDLDKAYESIRDDFLGTDFSDQLMNDLEREFKTLNKPIVVRSSATDEDGSKNSFAGQHESILGITDLNEMMDSIKECYASLFTPRAIEYRKKQRLSKPSSMAIVVQEMINAKVAGVAYSTSPTDENKILIESSFGLGTSIVEGKPCDIFRIDNNIISDIEYEISPKKRYREVFNPKKKKIVIENVPNDLIDKPSLSDEQIREVARTAKRIERIYSPDHPDSIQSMDIEFAYDSSGKLWILQARPLTALDLQGKEELPDIPQNEIIGESFNIRKTGVFEGPAIVIKQVDPIGTSYSLDGDLEELDRKFNKGYVLITPQTNPEIERYLKNVRAIAAIECGLTGHAAATAAERGIIYLGMVKGRKDLRDIIKNGEPVGIAATRKKGIIYKVR
jgi:pyruvate,water dikinase